MNRAPQEAMLKAAHDALVRCGSMSRRDLSLAQELAHPVHGRVLRAYATALQKGQQPFSPPTNCRPAVVAPEPPSFAPHHQPLATRPAIDMKRRAAGERDDD